MKLTKKGFTLVELMVVIVIVGILAAVAIPKFIMASHKAKASEFPTVLMQIYTAEIAYQAESGSYSDMSAIGLSVSSSKWFSYSIPAVTATTFTGQAEVTTAFGQAAVGQQATINESGTRGYAAGGSGGLSTYATNW